MLNESLSGFFAIHAENGGAFSQDEKVEVLYGSRAAWFPGQMTADNHDGTYKVSFPISGAAPEDTIPRERLRHLESNDTARRSQRIGGAVAMGGLQIANPQGRCAASNSLQGRVTPLPTLVF